MKHNEAHTDKKHEHSGTKVRGQYVARCLKAANVVVLDPEVQKKFPNSRAVNDALRALIALARTTGLSPQPQRKLRKRTGD
jgi:phage terminase small subunit